MVGDSSSLRRGAAAPIYRRSWSLARRMRAARRGTAEIVGPALTAVKAHLPKPQAPRMPWTTANSTTSAESYPVVSLRTTSTNNTTASGIGGSAGVGRRHESLSRSPNRGNAPTRSVRSWARASSSRNTKKIRYWAQRSRKELSYLSCRLRRVAGTTTPGGASSSTEQPAATEDASAAGSAADTDEAIQSGFVDILDANFNNATDDIKSDNIRDNPSAESSQQQVAASPSVDAAATQPTNETIDDDEWDEEDSRTAALQQLGLSKATLSALRARGHFLNSRTWRPSNNSSNDQLNQQTTIIHKTKLSSRKAAKRNASLLRSKTHSSAAVPKTCVGTATASSGDTATKVPSALKNIDALFLGLVSKERDNLKKDLKKANRDREDSFNNRLPQSSDRPANYGSSSGKQPSISGREYELLKLHYEKTLMELQALRKQNQEITRKYESAAKEAEYYRKQEKATYGSLQNVRMQYDEVIAEKQKLQHEVNSLQNMMADDRKEIADLRRQQQEAMSQEGSGEAINQLYLSTAQKYEAVKDEYDALRKRYSELAASHSNLSTKLEQTQEESSRVSKHSEEVVREKNCLKQQCTEAIRQWDTALREKNKLQEEIIKCREKCDDLMKEMNGHLLHRQHLGKDVKKLQEERNSVMHEYTLVMGERDQVHKEMEQLQEELNQSNNAIKTHQQTIVDRDKEKESLLLQLETLKREISSSLHDRDSALKDLAELRERTGAQDESGKHWDTQYKHYDGYNQQRERNVPEVSSLGSSGGGGSYSGRGKERLDNLDQANQEIDRLRKTVEKLQGELQEGAKETEVSKRRRDWAFSERDKIVRERESIRAHSDKLRNEKDRAVAKLAEALRDSDDMKKNRDDLVKQLTLAKEQLESERRLKFSAVQELCSSSSHASSKDSAIHTGTPPDQNSPPHLHHHHRHHHPQHHHHHHHQQQQWDVVNISTHMGNYSEDGMLGSCGGLGFEVCGGAGDSPGMYVTSVHRDSPFYGKLRQQDELVRINGRECSGVMESSEGLAALFGALRAGGPFANITVRRNKTAGATGLYRGLLHTSHLHCPVDVYHGVSLLAGVYVAAIQPGSPADIEPSITTGDRVISINGKSVDGTGIGSKEAQQLLDTGVGDVVQITILKSLCSTSSSPHSTAPISSTSSSGHNLAGDADDAGGFASTGKDLQDPAAAMAGLRITGREPVKKFVRRPVIEECLPSSGGGSDRKYGSMERGVYTVTKPVVEKGSGKWDQLKSIVRPRRHSKERVDSRDNKVKHGIALSIEQEKENALAQLDSVISKYHHKSGPGNSHTTKSPKKREKEKSGGTWPKYKGGTLSMWDPNAETTVAKQPRRDRPPLSMYAPNLGDSEYDTHDMKPAFDVYHPPKHIDVAMININARSTSSSPHPQGFSIYKPIDSDNTSNQQFSNNTGYPSSSSIYSNQPGLGAHNKQTVYSSASSRPGLNEIKAEETERDRENRLGSLTPSDTSLDFSVRSGNVGKEELEYYVKKNIVKCPFSDSESNVSPVDMNASPQPLSLPTTYGYKSYHLRQLPEGNLASSNTRNPIHPHTGLYSPTAGLRSPSTFVPYSSFSHYTHQHSHPHTTVASILTNSSARYSSPSPFLLPSRSGDSLLSSPGQDRDPRDVRNHYEQRLVASPSPSLVGRGSLGVPIPPSGTSGGFYQLSASPSQEFGSGSNSNNINKLINKSIVGGGSGTISSNTSLNSGSSRVHHNGGGHYHYQQVKSRQIQHQSGGGLLPSLYARTASTDDPINYMPLLPSASLLLPPATCPPSYHDYQRAVSTMPRKRDDDRLRISSTPGSLMKSSSSSSERSSPSVALALADSEHLHLLQLQQHRHSSPPPVGVTISAGALSLSPLTVGGGGILRSPPPTATATATVTGPDHHKQIFYSVNQKSTQEYQWQARRPSAGEIRNILLEKDTEPLGIQIRCLQNGGVFVSAVTGSSLAEKVGIIVGDQLLEVCGINMRSATKKTASMVLSQCGKSVTMLVQNSSDKYEELEGWQGSSSGSSLLEGPSRSGTPTPRNSPKPHHHHHHHYLPPLPASSPIHATSNTPPTPPSVPPPMQPEYHHQHHHMSPPPPPPQHNIHISGDVLRYDGGNAPVEPIYQQQRRPRSSNNSDVVVCSEPVYERHPHDGDAATTLPPPSVAAGEPVYQQHPHVVNNTPASAAGNEPLYQQRHLTPHQLQQHFNSSCNQNNAQYSSSGQHSIQHSTVGQHSVQHSTVQDEQSRSQRTSTDHPHNSYLQQHTASHPDSQSVSQQEQEEDDDDDDGSLPPSSSSTLRSPLHAPEAVTGGDLSLPPSARSTLTRPQIAHVLATLSRQDTFKRSQQQTSVEDGNSSHGTTDTPQQHPTHSAGSSHSSKHKTGSSRKNSSCSSSSGNGSRGSSSRSSGGPARSSGGSRNSGSRSRSSGGDRRSRSLNGTEEPRIIYLESNKSPNLGVRMVGGNALGVFVHNVMADSPASRANLRPGDRILEFNGHDLRYATAEQASYELAKPAENVAMLVQYDLRTYSIVQEQPGDSFYVRALFDNLGSEGTQELQFRKDDILYVDNTLYNSVPGVWRAWHVDHEGKKRNWGTIPSKEKVDEALVQRGGSGVDLSTLPFSGGTILSSISGGGSSNVTDASRRGSTTARRSFFRRKKHSRSSSRDSKELASFSDASLNSCTDNNNAANASMHEDTLAPSSYIRVERLDYMVRRPVLLLGPLWEFVADKLVHEYPMDFVRSWPEINHRASGEQLEAAVSGGLVVEYRRRGHCWEVTTVQQVREVADKNCYGILDVSLSAVERLQRHNIYPIVIILKFRSHKQVREMCDSLQHTLDKVPPKHSHDKGPHHQKISQKEAKEMYELCNKLEVDYKSVVSAVVPAVVNMAYMCTQVMACVASEQSKPLWLPA